MTYYNTNTNRILGKSDLLASGITVGTQLAQLGIYPVRRVVPEHDARLEYTEMESSDIDGSEWVIRYKVVPMSPEVIAERLMAAGVDAANRARAEADASVDIYMRQFSEVERQTWPKQQAEVEAWLADNTAPTPTLDGLAVARGISRDVMLAKASEKVTLFEQLSIAVVGRQQAYEDAIKAVVEGDKSPAEKLDELAEMGFVYGPPDAPPDDALPDAPTPDSEHAA